MCEMVNLLTAYTIFVCWIATRAEKVACRFFRPQESSKDVLMDRGFKGLMLATNAMISMRQEGGRFSHGKGEEMPKEMVVKQNTK